VKLTADSALVGHVYLSGGKEGLPPPVMDFGEDWRSDLLTAELIGRLIAAADEHRIMELAQRVVSEDTVIFHVYATPQEDGGRRFDLFDCDCKHNPKPVTTDN
jgi:hypothetical protein